MAKHNKKRNVGPLHEQLIRHASRMTVEGNIEKAQSAVDIVTNHFKKESEMLREFRLFSSLIHTRVDSKDLARRIVEDLGASIMTPAETREKLKLTKHK